MNVNLQHNYSTQAFTGFRFSKSAQRQLTSILATYPQQEADKFFKLIESQKDNPVPIFVSKLSKIRKNPVKDSFCIKVADSTFDNSAYVKLYDFFKSGAVVADSHKVRYSNMLRNN